MTRVPVPTAVAIVACVAPDNAIWNVSSGSTVVSPRIVTFTSFAVSPGANVTVPLVAR